MKRRDFLRKSAGGALSAGILTTGLVSLSASPKPDYADRGDDKWQHLGNSATGTPSRKRKASYDVAVLGGGLAGICAAVSAARNGAKVVLVQDRPVLGGNSSSEMRVHVNGVGGLKPNYMPERETGIIEEILLANRFQNPQEAYTIWDHVLYEYATREKNLTLMLNTQAIDAVMSGNTIKAAKCLQYKTETEWTISAKQFIDCSGDGMLAAKAGAEYRTGREGKAEFNERFAPDKPDGWQMGATLLIASKDMGKKMPFTAPHFALKYDGDKSHKGRSIANFMNGIWWLEVGSDSDIIADFENMSAKLMGYLYGVWDYIKNSGKYPEADNHALTWVGSIPAMRESRRFIGDYVLKEGDLIDNVNFKDAVAYGGWSLDEHCWAGLENLQDPPSYFHYHFSEIYQIPFRSLYSRNIDNLLFAGRNISQTHIALSSSRVMATCSLMGQAVGTAAMLCCKYGVNPRGIYENHLMELQEQLMRDDAYIPKRAANDERDLARKANKFSATSTKSGDVKNLVNGISRDIDGNINHWQSVSLPASVTLEWKKAQNISKIELKCDTNLQRQIFMHKARPENDRFTQLVPKELLKSVDLEARIGKEWIKIGSVDNNQTRLIKFSFDTIKADAIRFTATETYGVDTVKLFEIRAYEV